MHELLAVTTIDGRYSKQVKELSTYFSEAALMRFRLLVEVEYLIALCAQEDIGEVESLSIENKKKLRQLYHKFTLSDAQDIKNIEKEINHDVKSIEYFLKNKLEKIGLQKYSEFIHFALTSEDVNNLSYSLMLKLGVEKIILPQLYELQSILKNLSISHKDISLLSLTHGQPATPTTIGKEFAVYYNRLQQQIQNLEKIQLTGKLNGASGNYAAAVIAYPNVDWIEFSNNFINQLGLKPNYLTTQIEPHDTSAQLYDNISRINNIIKNFDQDIWFYISRKIFKLKKKDGEVGSSTMPHKVNPIDFENSEGNLGLANCTLRFMSDKLCISRLQRDLTDSTVLRNQGVALGYSILAYKNTIKGLNKLEVDEIASKNELNNNWAVLAEAIQTVLRKKGYDKPYEKLKELTRGQVIDKKVITDFLNGLDLEEKEKRNLLELTPDKYVGLSSQLVDLLLK